MAIRFLNRKNRETGGGGAQRWCRACGSKVRGAKFGLQDCCSNPECHRILVARSEQSAAR
jgi:hypothetical protein